MKAALKLNGIVYEVDITDEQAKQIEETNEKFVLTENEQNAVLKAFDESLGVIDELKANILAVYATVEKAKAANNDYEFSDEEVKNLFNALSAYGLNFFTRTSTNSYCNDEMVQSVLAKLSRIAMKKLGPLGTAVGIAFNGYGGCAT